MAVARGLDRVERPRLYEQVVERLLDHVIEGQLRPGDRLPPERDLAERLGVSRATVAQALVALEVLGVIDVQHGNGAVLLYRPSSAAVLRGLREHADRLPDIVDARIAVETRLAALAAARRTPEDLAAVESALEVMAEDIARGGRGLEGDELFHAAVTAAAHSAVLARLMAQISDLVRETRIESLSQEGRPERSLESHRAIARAIRDQDPDEASQAMVEHLHLVSDVAVLKPE
ncbi:GntR family transcriptional regulator [Kocuria dechangensis]|uniref:GntR family transcriptional regulator n=1 Tax=Kocuria dechangensis TaxID=1176249 RepID=A0A917LXM5_9MICC|nr:FCD domain-containing protein [Kocuria dechangensis]GGG63878.1 GntR family transcriptional regulator [Kocuria dechangensis]